MVETKVVNLVVDKLADMGYKNLHLAASSLSDVHAPPAASYKERSCHPHFHVRPPRRTGTGHFRGHNGREPVIFRSHGGRGAAIANGDLHIDVAFLGASSCDAF